MRYITVSIKQDIDVDIDEIIDQLKDDDLLDEVRERDLMLRAHEEANENLSLDYDMKIQVINENLHKFSYIEICDIFENKK